MDRVGSRLPAGAHAEYTGGAGVAGARVCSGPGQEARGRAVGSLCLSWEGAGRSIASLQAGAPGQPRGGGKRVPPHHARSVINTESVIIPVIMVQRETAGGNNSAPFVLTETSPL